MTVPSCTCELCQDCCKNMPGALVQIADLEAVECETRLPDETEEDWAERVLVASDGAILMNQRGERLEVPNLSLAASSTGGCAFFYSGRCGIYPGRPSGCRDFGCSQTRAEGDAVSLPMILDRIASMREERGARYWRLWTMLHDRGIRRRRAEIRDRSDRMRLREVS